MQQGDLCDRQVGIELDPHLVKAICVLLTQIPNH